MFFNKDEAFGVGEEITIFKTDHIVNPEKIIDNKIFGGISTKIIYSDIYGNVLKFEGDLMSEEPILK